MRRPVALAWVFGLVLAVLAVAVGPDRLGATIAQAVAWLGAGLHELQFALAPLSYETMRGLAIGAFATFVVLCAITFRQGRPARLALVVVSATWLFLVSDGTYGRWDLACLLAVVAALVMTRRALAG